MPGMTSGKRASGGWVDQTDLPLPPEWELLAARDIPLPDQSRYGTATTDPLGRDGPGWHKNPKTGLYVKEKDAT